MKKVFLYTALLLILAVVLTTPAAAAKGRPGPPERGEEKVVKFTDDISSGGSTVTMIFHKKGGNIRFYNEDRPVQLYFSGKFNGLYPPPSEFSGEHPSWSIVIKMKEGEPPEATMWIEFGERVFQGDRCPRKIAPYQLRGFGTFAVAGRTYTITLTDTKIYDVKYVPPRSKNCKGAWGKEYIDSRSLTGNIIFGMDIQ